MVGASSLLLLTDAWRLSLAALLGLYTIISILLGIATNPVLGVVQAVVGVFAIAILYVTMQSLNAGGVEHAISLPYRLATGAFALVVAFSLAETYPLVDVPLDLNFAIYWLSTLGLIMLVTARRVLAIGFALFMLESVALVLLTVFNQGPGLTRLLLAGLAQIAIAVALSYLLLLERDAEQLA